MNQENTRLSEEKKNTNSSKYEMYQKNKVIGDTNKVILFQSTK